MLTNRQPNRYLQQDGNGVALANSPLLPSNSLPLKPIQSRPGIDNFRMNTGYGSATGNAYHEFADSKAPFVYPTIIVNGMIKDVNDIIKQIVLNKAFHPQFNDMSHVSYVDPVSKVPILCPGRGTNCKHSQCFDIAEFLILQNDSQEWTCPICSEPLSIDTLYYDPLFFSSQKNNGTNSFDLYNPDNVVNNLGAEASDFNGVEFDEMNSFFDDFG